MIKPNASETDPDTDVAAFKLDEGPTQPLLHHARRARREEPATKLAFGIRAPAPSHSESAAPLPERRTPQDSPRLHSSEAEADPAVVPPSIDDASLTCPPPRPPPVKAPVASAAQRRPGVSEEPLTRAISPELLELARSMYPAAPKAPGRPAAKAALPATSSIMTKLVPLQLTLPDRAPTAAVHRAATPQSSTPKTRTAPSLQKRRAAALRVGGCATALVLGALWLSRSQLQAALAPPNAPNRPAPALLETRPAALAAEQAQRGGWPEGPVELATEPAQPRAALARAAHGEPPRAAGRGTLAGDAPAGDAPAGDAPASDAPVSTLAALEKQAVDRLIANEYEAAYALYTQLQAATPRRTEYAVMTKLLERRLRADCGAGHPCP